MNTPPVTLWNVLLALLPIFVILYLMVGRQWGGSKAGPAGWATAVLISLIFFGAGPQLQLVAWGKAIFLALFVLYIIWMALLFYHTVNEAGVITAIGRELPGLAKDKPAQALLLAWIFGSFLQGATGFGVPAAVVAPLIVGLGFAPDIAVVMALVGHAWAVTFGSLGSSYLSLMATTGLPGEFMAGTTSQLLELAAFSCGFAVLWLAGGWKGIRRRGLFLIIFTIIMGSTQWFLASRGLWTVAAFGAGLVGLVLAIAYFRVSVQSSSFNASRLLRAFQPYFILIVVIVAGQLVLGNRLDFLVLAPTFPEVSTRLGWTMAAGPGRTISIFGHAGALLIYTSAITFIWYRQRGVLPEAKSETYDGRSILRKTLKGSIKPTIGIYALVAMALTMEHAGMTQLLAEALSANTGPLFAFISPFIGALGAFMTGSNTNSNVVFGQLQQQTAVALDLSVAWVLAAQTAGGAIGGLFAPAKVIVGVSTVGGANEGRVLKLATLTGLGITAVLGLFALWMA